ncbi:MAG: MBL fold metallo-hydrolase [Anaerolineae bacterium]
MPAMTPYAITIPTPFPVGPVNVYLLPGPEPALIDTGPSTAKAWDALEAGLSTQGLAVAGIRQVVLTHAHPDHYGLAARVVAASGARVHAHALAASTLTSPGARSDAWEAFYGRVLAEAGVPPQVVDGMGQAFQAALPFRQPVALDVALQDGDRLSLGGKPWQVLHTPGHAQEHICLYQPDSGQLLSGDHLLRDISSNPILEPPLPGETVRPRSLVQYLASLERIAALEVTTAWPGHGAPITHHRQLITQRLDLHRRRAERIATLLESGPQTAFQIATTLFPGQRGMNSFLAVSEVIGHLDLLVAEGRVRSRRSRVGIVFEAVPTHP